MASQHILREFDGAVQQLRQQVLAMASQARLNLERAMQALFERNTELANAVIADDNEVDDYERSVDKLGMEILLKFHPVARDLRLVVTSMKVSMNLERIADHASTIAKRARKIANSGQELEDMTLLEPLYTLADQLLLDAISSYSDLNTELAESLGQRDKEIDKQHKKLTKLYSSRLETSGKSAEYLHLILITRSLERVGDLATNIGENAVFLGDARDIRHEG